jgi:hypothetical protein
MLRYVLHFLFHLGSSCDLHYPFTHMSEFCRICSLHIHLARRLRRFCKGHNHHKDPPRRSDICNIFLRCTPNHPSKRICKSLLYNPTCAVLVSKSSQQEVCDDHHSFPSSLPWMRIRRSSFHQHHRHQESEEQREVLLHCSRFDPHPRKKRYGAHPC